MRIIFQKNILIEAVTYALCAVSNKNTISSVKGILIETVSEEKCRLSSFDFDKGVNIVIDAKVEESGSCIINAQRLSQIIRIMPESEVAISLNGDIASLESGKSVFEVTAQRGDEFPAIPELDTEIGFTIKQDVLFGMISQTLFAVSQVANSNQRTIFTGLLFDINGDCITVVGCDGYRLAIKRVTCEMENASENMSEKVIIPGKTLSELMKIIGDTNDDITIKVSKKHIVFELEDKSLTFFSRLLDGEYIEYERLIPKQFNTFVTADSDIFISALERASLVSEENTSSGSKSYVRLNIRDDALEISSVSSKGRVKDEIFIEKEGASLEIGFKCRYLIESIKACKAEKIKISFVSNLIGIVMEPTEEKDNEKLIMFIQPTRIK